MNAADDRFFSIANDSSQEFQVQLYKNFKDIKGNIVKGGKYYDLYSDSA